MPAMPAGKNGTGAQHHLQKSILEFHLSDAGVNPGRTFRLALLSPGNYPGHSPGLVQVTGLAVT